MPSIGVSIAICTFLFAGEQAIPAIFDLASGTAMPIMNAPMFGMAAQGGPGGPPPEGPEDDDDDDGVADDLLDDDDE